MSYDPNKAAVSGEAYAGQRNQNNGVGREPYLDTTKVGGSVEFLKVEPNKKHLVDIIPFPVTSKNFPGYDALRSRYKSADEMVYEVLDIFIHKNIGPTGANIVCPKKNYGLPCPICEDINAKFKSGEFTRETKEYKDIKAKRRNIYVVADLLDGGKFKLFDYSWYFFTKFLDEAKLRAREEKEQVNLYDISKHGVSIKFYPSAASEEYNKKDGSASAGQIASIDFVDREKGYDESVFAKIPSPDKMLVVKTYEEIEAIYHGIVPTYTESDEFEDDDNEESSPVVETPKPEPETEKPVERELTAEERRAKRKQVVSNPCPYGNRFPEDNINVPDCNKCEKDHADVYEKCTDAYLAQEGK